MTKQLSGISLLIKNASKNHTIIFERNERMEEGNLNDGQKFVRKGKLQKASMQQRIVNRVSRL